MLSTDMLSTDMKDLIFSCIDIQDIAIKRVERGDYVFCEAVSVDVSAMKRIEKSLLSSRAKKTFKDGVIYFSSLSPEFIYQAIELNNQDKERESDDKL